MAQKYQKLIAFIALLLAFSWLLTTNESLAQSGKTIPKGKKDVKTVAKREDIKSLPQPLKDALLFLAGAPNTFVPSSVYNEFFMTKKNALLFQYYLINAKGFEPNAFTTRVPGFTDGVAQGTVRVIISPDPNSTFDPNSPAATIDIYVDAVAILTVSNEAGWYESWLMHDIKVPAVDAPRADGTAQFGKITSADADALKKIGAGNNVPGNLFTLDGNAPRFPSLSDSFPNAQSNLLPVQVSGGAVNSVGETDLHSYHMFNNSNNWSYPIYELPFTGGLPKVFPGNKIGAISSVVPGSGPSGVTNDPTMLGDNPANPRDPDFSFSPQAESRNRNIPSGLAREVLLDAFVRVASFEPNVTDMTKRIFDAYAKEIARVDKNGDGAISFAEADITSMSDGLPNSRLYIPATQYNRFAITREINDGLIAPRFAPSQRAFILSGTQVVVNPAVPAAIQADQQGG